jgi:hypothetical protein
VIRPTKPPLSAVQRFLAQHGPQLNANP